jgi:hypothetical protein
MRPTRSSAAVMASMCAALAASCAPPPSAAERPDPTFTFSECPVLGSRDWKAWISAMPGPDAVRTLHIEGEVDLPTPGYRVALIPGPADRMMPPDQRFALAANASDAVVAQVVTPTPVRYAGKAGYQEYRAITIGCGGKILTRIENIETAY